MPNIAIICLGANGTDAAEQLEKAFATIQTLGTVVKSTPVYPSDPEYARDIAPYLNRIVLLHTDSTYSLALQYTKNYQTLVRARAGIAPLVAIDIDIVVWNGATVRPGDAKARYYLKGIMMLS